MFRKTARKTVSEEVRWHQDQALSTTIFILTEFGPTGFLLKEDGESKNYKVCLGDPHTCTCATFQKEKKICKHICWILMRKFRLPRDHEYCFQTALVDRQILEILQGVYRVRTPQPTASGPSAPPQPGSSGEDGTVRQKAIGEDDICPICQEELMKKRLPVTHCRYGCGNNVHISCMKVWADHQTRSETEVMVKCPLCREAFGELKLLLEQVKYAGKLYTLSERERLDKHLGIPCNKCRVFPIVGKCFKCSICSYFHLCEECYKRSCHPHHTFIARMKRNQPWQPVEHGVDHPPNKAQMVDSQLMNGNDVSDGVPEHVVKSLPVIRVRLSSTLLEMGMQCRFCLQSFHLGQYVKTLPCRHKFHADCIDIWLRQSVCCPLDWHNIYNPLVWNRVGVQASKASAKGAKINLFDQQQAELFIPGFGLLDRTGKIPGLQRTGRSDISTAGALNPLSIETLSQHTQTLCINSPDSGMNGLECCSRESRSKQRGGSLEKSASCRRVGVKFSFPDTSSPLTSACIIRKIKGSERTQEDIFPKLNEHPSKSQPKHNAFPGHFKHLNHFGSISHKPRYEDLSVLDLWMTGIPISAKHQRQQES